MTVYAKGDKCWHIINAEDTEGVVINNIRKEFIAECGKKSADTRGLTARDNAEPVCKACTVAAAHVVAKTQLRSINNIKTKTKL